MTRAAQLAGLGSLEGSAPAYACRAWVNFNGQGTVAIRASGNVSSITDNGTGNYTVNFATAMPDANASVAVSKQNWSTYTNSIASSNCNIITATASWVANDDPIVSVAVFR